MECLDEERVLGLVQGTLSASELLVARAHLGECETCRELVAETVRSAEVSSGGAGEESGVAHGEPSVDVVAETVVESAADREARGIHRLAAGDLIDGKYRIEGVLGRGGMGTVFAALHVPLKREVAVKVLRPGLLSRKDVVGRFMREARAAARIRSPHVVGVLDVGGLPTGEPYIVMERLRGNDLSQEITALGSLDVRVSVDYVIDICEAVAHAHAMGVIHRDLKPANVFLCKADGVEPQVKVLDFGISKISDRTPDSAPEFSTELQTWLGTPRYMAPEQITLGRKVDERADIWAIGTILYELISGHPPFQDKSLEILCKRLLEDEAPSLSETSRKKLPRRLEAIVGQCFEKVPEQRFPNVGALARALIPYGSPSKQTTLQRISALPGMASRPGETRRKLRSATPRHVVVLVVAAVGLVSVASWLARREVGSTSADAKVGARIPSAEPSSVPSSDAPPTSRALPDPEPPSEAREVGRPSTATSSAAARRPAPRAAPTAKHPEFGGRL
jgi:eukaryotic-like serine/threonine-protein kinase